MRRRAAAVAVPAVVFFVLSAAGSAPAQAMGRHQTVVSSPDPDPATVIASLTPVPGAALRTSLEQLSGFTASDQQKVGQAVDLMEHILNSEQFRQAVLGFTYGGQKAFVQNYISDGDGNLIQSNMTNEQVYETIMNGAEQLKGVDPRVDHVADLNLNLYNPPWYNKWGTVGYGNPGEPEIYMNRLYFESYELSDVADNVTHEWTHKLGYEHDYKSTDRRPFSVPYGIGCIVEKIATLAPPSDCYDN